MILAACEEELALSALVDVVDPTTLGWFEQADLLRSPYVSLFETFFWCCKISQRSIFKYCPEYSGLTAIIL